MRTEASDVTVVGASAAGLLTAERLASAGREVQVLERSPSLGPARRTLIATARLRDVLGTAAESAITNEINTFELFADGMVASVALRRPDVIVERSALLQGLADRARAAGATVTFGRSFLGAESSGGRVSIVARDEASKRAEAVTSDVVVGADGANSRVASEMGWAAQTTVPLVQAVVRCPSGMPPDTVRVWFRPHETPYFYWLIPDGDGTGVLGLIGEDRTRVRSDLDSFLRDKELRPLGYQAARIPLYTRWRRVRRGSVYLVGDAAGHVKSSTVGGLVTGFRGALGVADRILGRRTGLLRSLRIELDLHITLRRILHRFGEDDYKRLLGLLRPAEHRLLGAYTRDETPSLLLRLAAREPRLGLVALRALISRGQSDAPEVSFERAAQSSALT